MHTRQLGTTDMQITPPGLGTWAIGGGNYQFGWGSQDDKNPPQLFTGRLNLASIG